MTHSWALYLVMWHQKKSSFSPPGATAQQLGLCCMQTAPSGLGRTESPKLWKWVLSYSLL